MQNRRENRGGAGISCGCGERASPKFKTGAPGGTLKRRGVYTCWQARRTVTQGVRLKGLQPNLAPVSVQYLINMEAGSANLMNIWKQEVLNLKRGPFQPLAHTCP